MPDDIEKLYSPVGRPIANRAGQGVGIITQVLMARGMLVAPNNTDEDPNRTWLEAMADALFTEAQKGDVAAARVIAEYIQGKPVPTITPAQALFVIQNTPPEELATLLRMPQKEFQTEFKQYQEITAGEPKPE